MPLSNMSERCEALTKTGSHCKLKSVPGTKTCRHHSGQTCSVCMNHMNDTNSRTLDCSHTFHTRCLDRWKQRSNTCPICRAPFDEPKYTIKISIEPIGTVSLTVPSFMSMITSNLVPVRNMFGLDPNLEHFFTDIRFQVNDEQSLHDVLTTLGFPGVNASSFDTVGTAEL